MVALAVVALAVVAVGIDTLLGSLFIGCLAARAVTRGREHIAAKVIEPLATTWILALAVLLGVDGIVSVRLAVTGNAYTTGAVTKAIGQLSGIVAILSSFTFFGATQTLPKHAEQIQQSHETTRLEDLQARFDKSRKNEEEIWRRYFAVSVIKQALEAETTAASLVAWTSEIDRVPATTRAEVARLLLDPRRPEITPFEERQYAAFYEQELRESTLSVEEELAAALERPKKEPRQLDPLFRAESQASPWFTSYTSDATVQPVTLADGGARVEEQQRRERDAAAAAAELEAGFKAIVAKTVDAPRKVAFNRVIADVIAALTAETSPLVQEIARAVFDNATRETVSRAVESHAARVMQALRTRYWSLTSPRPRVTVESARSYDRLRRTRSVVRFTIDAHKAAERASAAELRNEHLKANKAADEAEELSESAQKEAALIDRSGSGRGFDNPIRDIIVRATFKCDTVKNRVKVTRARVRARAKVK